MMTQRWNSKTGLVASAATAALVLTACGGTDRDNPIESARGWIHAIGDEDAEAACQFMLTTYGEPIENGPEEEAETCEQQISESFFGDEDFDPEQWAAAADGDFTIDAQGRAQAAPAEPEPGEARVGVLAEASNGEEVTGTLYLYVHDEEWFLDPEDLPGVTAFQPASERETDDEEDSAAEHDGVDEGLDDGVDDDGLDDAGSADQGDGLAEEDGTGEDEEPEPNIDLLSEEFREWADERGFNFGPASRVLFDDGEAYAHVIGLGLETQGEAEQTALDGAEFLAQEAQGIPERDYDVTLTIGFPNPETGTTDRWANATYDRDTDTYEVTFDESPTVSY